MRHLIIRVSISRPFSRKVIGILLLLLLLELLLLYFRLSVCVDDDSGHCLTTSEHTLNSWPSLSSFIFFHHSYLLPDDQRKLTKPCAFVEWCLQTFCWSIQFAFSFRLLLTLLNGRQIFARVNRHQQIKVAVERGALFFHLPSLFTLMLWLELLWQQQWLPVTFSGCIIIIAICSLVRAVSLTPSLCHSA